MYTSQSVSMKTNKSSFYQNVFPSLNKGLSVPANEESSGGLEYWRTEINRLLWFNVIKARLRSMSRLI